MVFVHDILTHLKWSRKDSRGLLPRRNTTARNTNTHTQTIYRYINIHHADWYVGVGAESSFKALRENGLI